MANKKWVFTLNNYTEEECRRVDAWETKRLVVGKEVSASGTPHLQGYVEWCRPYSLNKCRQLLERAHWEVSFDPASAINYNTKETLWLNKSTEKIDFGKYIMDSVRGGMSDRQMCEEHSQIVFMLAAVGRVRNMYVEHRKSPPEVYWLWGPTGLGKTRWVEETYGDYQPVCLSGQKSNPFVEGYTGMKQCVLFDDFRPEQCSMAWLLRITDRYRCVVNMKGYSLPWNPAVIVFTCPLPPDAAYGMEDVTQLTRRITKVVEYK